MERFTTEWASDHDELLKAEATDPIHLETGLVDSVYAQFIGGVQTAVDTVAKGCRSKRGTNWATFDWRRTARSHVGELICRPGNSDTRHGCGSFGKGSPIPHPRGHEKQMA
jgi:hypothetical protein